jgi:glutamine synthetase
VLRPERQPLPAGRRAGRNRPGRFDGDGRLPAEVTGDPAARSEAELESLGVKRLPQSLDEALIHLEGSEVLRDALGSALLGAFVAVRRAELATLAGATPEEIVVATRWRH